MSYYDPEYDDDSEAAELRAEARYARRFRNMLARHPDPRDPDWPGDDEEEADSGNEEGEEGSDWWEYDDDSEVPSPAPDPRQLQLPLADPLDPPALNTEWDADAC